MTSRRALDAVSVPLAGVQLIEASAGTGKTYTITSLLLRAIVEQREPLERIAVVTFTQAATAELKERVGARLGAAREALQPETQPSSDQLIAQLQARPDRPELRRLLDRALGDLDKAAIFTIHGFAQRMLLDFAFESGAHYGLELLGDQAGFVYDAAIDFWSAVIGPLSSSEFRWLGGGELLAEFKQVAKEAAASPDVPLVAVSPERRHVDTSHFEALYRRAQALFERDAGELVGLIVAAKLNKGTYTPEKLVGDLEAWRRLFARDEASQPLPDGGERWRRSVMERRRTKASILPSHEFFDLVDELFEQRAVLEGEFEARRVQLRGELVRFVRKRVADRHRLARSQSFDQLLLTLRNVLRDPERGALVAARIRERYGLVLIDEFQDTDPVQYEIFRLIFAQQGGGCGLFLIGDPKQSIYGFRGADVNSYLAASRDSSAVWTLATSYRASPQLTRAQNALFGRAEWAFGMPEIRYEPLSTTKRDLLRDARGGLLPGLEIVECAERNDTIEQTAREVERFLTAGHTLEGLPLTARRLTVLTRTNAQALAVQTKLAQLGIPAVMHGDRSVFEQAEALELRRILLALSEPARASWLRAALATRLLGVSANGLHELDLDDAGLERWFEVFKARGDDWRERGVVHALEALDRDSGLVHRVLRAFDGERRLTNYRHLLELLHEAERRRHLGVTGLLRYLESAIANPMGHEMAAEAKQVRLESDEDAVTLTTVHKSKGLEYDVVFLADLGSLLPYKRRPAFRFHADEGESLLEVREPPEADASYASSSRDEQREALRLTYVALTRARHHVIALLEPASRYGVSPLFHYLAGASLAEVQSDKAKAIDAGRVAQARDELARESEGAIRFAPAHEGPPLGYRTGRAEVRLSAAPLPVPPAEGDRTSSFSAMTRHGARLSRASREGRDVDEHAVLGTVDEATAGAGKGRADRAIVLDQFPRGAGPGEALHGIFENSDFAEGTAELRRAVAARELSRRGLPGSQLEAVSRAVEDVLATPLSPSGFCLGQLERADKRAELEFSLPVGSGAARLSAGGLAQALRGEGEREAHGLAGDYLDRVAELGFSQWSGYLRGFIDLVYRDGARFFVVDYKSNYLGERYSDYADDALELSMREHHYHLQGRLYALAVHRHLQTRIADYDYERHFGGVVYLFVRGMHPDFGASLGVHASRPSAREMARLSAAFGDGGREWPRRGGSP